MDIPFIVSIFSVHQVPIHLVEAAMVLVVEFYRQDVFTYFVVMAIVTIH